MLLTGVRFFEVGINVTIFCCSAFEKINLSQYLMHSSPAKHESPLPSPHHFFFFLLYFTVFKKHSRQTVRQIDRGKKEQGNIVYQVIYQE